MSGMNRSNDVFKFFKKMQKKYISVDMNFDFIEANILKNYLQSKNITCFLVDEHSSIAAIAPIAITPRIFVNKKDATKARNIINNYMRHKTSI